MKYTQIHTHTYTQERNATRWSNAPQITIMEKIEFIKYTFAGTKDKTTKAERVGKRDMRQTTMIRCRRERRKTCRPMCVCPPLPQVIYRTL